MSEHARIWLNQWITDHVVSVPFPEQRRVAKQFAILCLAEAEGAGITRRELDEVAGAGGLARRLEREIEDRRDAAVRASRPASN